MLRGEDNFILSITQPQTNEAIGQDSVHQRDTFLNSFETTILNEMVGFVNFLLQSKMSVD